MSVSDSATPVAALRDLAAERPDAPCLTCDGGDYSYGRFLAAVDGQAAALVAAGADRGDRIAVLCEGFDTCYATIFACWAIGAVAVPLNPRLHDHQLAALVARCAARLLVGERQDREFGKPVLAPCLEPAPRPTAADDPAGDAIALIMYTSGTTGLPKGACQRMSAVWSNPRLTAAACGLTASDRVFLNTPPYFTSGLVHFLTMLAAGGSLEGRTGFLFGRHLLDHMSANGCTGFGGAPSHIVRVLAALEAPEHPAGLRFWVTSGDHLSADLALRFRHLLPEVSLLVMYGLTEVSGRLCILAPDELPARAGSAGRPIGDMAITVRDGDGRELPPDEVGEFYVTGNLVMAGYLDDPAATAAALTPHGLRTGDFGYVDADGFVWHRGRRDDVFKRGGEKVSTLQVRDALLALPAVRDAAVIGMPDELAGTVPVAAVVTDPDTPLASIRRALKRALPPASVPARILAVDGIPRTGSGKAQVPELRRLLEPKAANG